MVYRGRQSLQIQGTKRNSRRKLPSDEQPMQLSRLSVSIALAIFALMLAGDGMPIKHPVYPGPQAWQIRSKIVAEQGLIWIMEDTDD